MSHVVSCKSCTSLVGIKMWFSWVWRHVVWYIAARLLQILEDCNINNILLIPLTQVARNVIPDSLMPQTTFIAQRVEDISCWILCGYTTRKSDSKQPARLCSWQPYSWINRHSTPSNATTIIAVVNYATPDMFQTVWFIIRFFFRFLIGVPLQFLLFHTMSDHYFILVCSQYIF